LNVFFFFFLFFFFIHVIKQSPRSRIEIDASYFSVSLRFLDLTRCHMYSIAPLRHLTNLETLVLDRNPVGSLPPCVVGRMRALRRLSLRQTDIDNLYVTLGTLRMLPELRVLDFQLICVSGDNAASPPLSDGAPLTLADFSDSHLDFSESAFVRPDTAVPDFELLHDLSVEGPLLFDYPPPHQRARSDDDDDNDDNDDNADDDDGDYDVIPGPGAMPVLDVAAADDDNDNDHNVPATNPVDVEEPAADVNWAMWQSGDNEFGLAAMVAALRERAARAEHDRAEAAPEREPSEARERSRRRSAHVMLSSPICFERYYRWTLLHELPHLTRLDGAAVCESELEWVRAMRARLQKRGGSDAATQRASPSLGVSTAMHVSALRAPSAHCARTRGVYRDALVAARVMASGIPAMRVVRVRAPPLRRHRDAPTSSCDVCGAERRSLVNEFQFSPRQFEYSRHDASMLLCGTNNGEILLLDREHDELRGVMASNEHDQILGLSWLSERQHSSMFVVGSNNGRLRLYDGKVLQEELRQRGVPSRGTSTEACRLELPPFRRLTSVGCSADDRHLLTSGYSTSVSLVDLVTGQMTAFFQDMHDDNINVTKWMHNDPNLFATSSFDRALKLWDMRTDGPQQGTPCWMTESSDSIVMCCFSPDDRFLMSAGVDNEVRIFDMRAPERARAPTAACR
jgi:hypothetical protein